MGDKVDAATTLGELLRLWGHEVQTVHDGLEAIEIARVYQPEVIILDIGWPDLDGYKVAQRLRQEVGLSRSVLIALTEDTDRKEVNAVLRKLDLIITSPNR